MHTFRNIWYILGELIMNEYKRIEDLEIRVSFLENMIKRMMGESAWDHHLNGTPIKDTANDIGHPDCGSMN